MYKETISKESFKRLLLTILSLFFLFSLISALVLYKTSQISLNHHYGATHTILTQLKESIIIKTITINLIFYLLTAIGVIFLGTLYSHKIAGPLFRVKQYAAILGEGRFNEKIHFREKDAIHNLAFVMNEMAERCRERTGKLAVQLKTLEEEFLLLENLPDQSKEKIELMNRLMALDAKIKENLKKIVI